MAWFENRFNLRYEKEMRKGKGSLFAGLAMVVAFAALITGSMVAGYRFVTYFNKDTQVKFDEVEQYVEDTAEQELGIDVKGWKAEREEKKKAKQEAKKKAEEEKKAAEAEKNSPYVYKDQNTRAYDGPRIYESYSYIFNDRGECLTDFYEEGSYGLAITYDVDRKDAALLVDSTLYYINADLEYKMIEEDVDDAGVNYDGGYICFKSRRGVCVYDVAQDQTFVVDAYGNSPCISPDGQTLAFYNYQDGKKKLYVGGVGKARQQVDEIDGGYYNLHTISNDGKTIFCEIIKTGNMAFYCINEGDKEKLLGDYVWNCYFDRDCKQVIYERESKYKYYNATLDEEEKLSNKLLSGKLEILGVGYCTGSYYERDTIIDTDSFADVIMLSTGEGTYCLEGKIPKLVPIRGEGYAPCCGFTEAGPACMYSSGGELYRVVYENGKVNTQVIPLDEENRYDLTKGDTVDELFYVTYEVDEDSSSYTHYLYYLKVGEQPLRIADLGSDSYGDIKWDKHTKKCYYISDGVLYRCDRDGRNVETLFENCKSLNYEYSDYEPVGFTDIKGDKYIILEGMIYKK